MTISIHFLEWPHRGLAALAEGSQSSDNGDRATGGPLTPEDRFCASCASPLEMRQTAGKARPVCSSCGRVVYYDPKVVAVCVVARDGRVVMIRRASELGYGLWSFPGGYVDRGEVIEEAAARETWEETGLEVAVEGLLRVFSIPGDPVIVAAFTGRETGGTLAPGPEALEVGLFAPGEIPELAFSRDTEILALWAENYRPGP